MIERYIVKPFNIIKTNATKHIAGRLRDFADILDGSGQQTLPTIREQEAFANTPEGRLLQFLKTNTAQDRIDSQIVVQLYIDWVHTLPDKEYDTKTYEYVQLLMSENGGQHLEELIKTEQSYSYETSIIGRLAGFVKDIWNNLGRLPLNTPDGVLDKTIHPNAVILFNQFSIKMAIHVWQSD